MRHPKVVETASNAIGTARDVFNDVPATTPRKERDRNAKA